MSALGARVEELLLEAHEWRLLGLLFERPRGGWLAEIESLAAGARDPLLVRAVEAARPGSEGEYLAQLGPGGAASPREAGYRRTLDPAQLLAGLQGLYDAFAYAPRAEDPPDHVALEAGFAGWLALKQAYALAAGEDEAAALAARVAREFLEQHLRALAQPLRARLEGSDGHVALAAAALHARAGDRPADFEGGWVPDGLDEASCEAACGAREETEELPGEGILEALAAESRGAPGR